MFMPQWRIRVEDIQGFKSIEDSVYSATRRFQCISIDCDIDSVGSIGIRKQWIQGKGQRFKKKIWRRCLNTSKDSSEGTRVYWQLVFKAIKNAATCQLYWNEDVKVWITVSRLWTRPLHEASTHTRMIYISILQKKLIQSDLVLPESTKESLQEKTGQNRIRPNSYRNPLSQSYENN